MKWNGHLIETTMFKTYIKVVAAINVIKPETVSFQNIDNVLVGPVKDPACHTS